MTTAPKPETPAAAPTQDDLAARDKAKEKAREEAAKAVGPTIQVGGGPDSEVG